MATKKISIEWPMHIESGNWWGNYNTRGGRLARNAKAGQQRTTAWTRVAAALREKGLGSAVEKATVMIRVRRPRLLDSDNMIWGCKHIRDGIACALAAILPNKNAPDSPKDPYTWEYEQTKGKELLTIEIEY
jgi:hypothetical protein